MCSNQTVNADIICIISSWHLSEISNNKLAIDNYQSLRLDGYRHGGGVIMYVQSSLGLKVLAAGPSNLELLIVSIPP